MKEISEHFNVAKHFADTFNLLESKGIIKRGERSLIAQAMGISPPRLSEILKGRRDISGEELTKFVNKYGVNPFWILLQMPPILIKDSSHLTAYFLESEWGSEQELSTAAEPESNYKSASAAIYFEAHMPKKGKDKIEKISLNELSEILGLDEIRSLLEEIKSRLPSKKK